MNVLFYVVFVHSGSIEQVENRWVTVECQDSNKIEKKTLIKNVNLWIDRELKNNENI